MTPVAQSAYQSEMRYLLDDLNRALNGKAWYAATSLALALPDICARIDTPSDEVGSRYRRWAEAYFVPLMQAGGHTFFSAEELYRLRCRFLHEGDLRLFDQKPSDGFDRANHIQLVTCPLEVVPVRGLASSSNGDASASYTVRVDEFCERIGDAVNEWLEEALDDEAKIARIDGLLRIEHLNELGLPLSP